MAADAYQQALANLAQARDFINAAVGAMAGEAGPLAAGDGAAVLTPAVLDELTDREREVLALVATGLRNRGIARQLGISEKTVKNHLAAIFIKLGVSDRTQAAIRAVRAGLVGP